MAQLTDSKHLLGKPDGLKTTLCSVEENCLPQSHPLASPWISGTANPAVQTNMRTMICDGELLHRSRPSCRNQIGGLVLQSNDQTNNFSDSFQDLSSDGDWQTHLDCSITQTFFPLPQLLFILWWTEHAIFQTVF